VQDRAHFIGRQVNVGLRIVALHEAVAVTVAKHRAFEFGQQGRCGSGGGVICLDGFSLVNWQSQQNWDSGVSDKFKR
jgi:hypothetical protein